MNLNESDLGSDTDDDDYVPTGEGQEVSEEENSGDDENLQPSGESPPKKKKKLKATQAIGARKNMFEDENARDWNKELAEEKKELNEEKEKKKADDLWADFKKDTSKKAPCKEKSSSIASLFNDATKPVVSNHQSKAGVKSNTNISSLFDDFTQSDASNRESNCKSVIKKPQSMLSSLFDEAPVHSSALTTVYDENEKCAKDDKIEITQVFDFAGETVKVSKEVAADSAEAKKFLKSKESDSTDTGSTSIAKNSFPGKRPSGLAGIVGSIGKKQKMGCLDKSKLDWNSFVKEEGISEDLKTFNKGKDG